MHLLLAMIAVQIIAESLPISSSSHVRALTHFSTTLGSGQLPASIVSYLCDLLHLPTLIIFALFFYSRWQPVIATFIHEPLATNALPWRFITQTALASGITVLWYLFFTHVWDTQQFPRWCGLWITALLLTSTLLLTQQKTDTPYTYWHAMVLGCVQGIALLPGISRLGATVIIGCWLGLSARQAFEASIAMQAPLILAAVIRSVFYLAKSGFMLQLLQPAALLVMVLSTVGGYLGLYCTYALAMDNMLWIFAPYVALFSLLFFQGL